MLFGKGDTGLPPPRFLHNATPQVRARGVFAEATAQDPGIGRPIRGIMGSVGDAMLQIRPLQI
jgi:hypothetical protein